MERTLTAHGDLLERAREARHVSKREAAKRAGISEGRWRQIVTGYQSVGRGMTVPVKTTPQTLRAMAAAVGADPAAVLAAAGFDPSSEPPPTPLSPLETASDAELLAEVQRRFKRPL